MRLSQKIRSRARLHHLAWSAHPLKATAYTLYRSRGFASRVGTRAILDTVGFTGLAYLADLRVAALGILFFVGTFAVHAIAESAVAAVRGARLDGRQFTGEFIERTSLLACALVWLSLGVLTLRSGQQFSEPMIWLFACRSLGSLAEVHFEIGGLDITVGRRVHQPASVMLSWVLASAMVGLLCVAIGGRAGTLLLILANVGVRVGIQYQFYRRVVRSQRQARFRLQPVMLRSAPVASDFRRYALHLVERLVPLLVYIAVGLGSGSVRLSVGLGLAHALLARFAMRPVGVRAVDAVQAAQTSPGKAFNYFAVSIRSSLLICVALLAAGLVASTRMDLYGAAKLPRVLWLWLVASLLSQLALQSLQLLGRELSVFWPLTILRGLLLGGCLYVAAARGGHASNFEFVLGLELCCVALFWTQLTQLDADLRREAWRHGGGAADAQVLAFFAQRNGHRIWIRLTQPLSSKTKLAHLLARLESVAKNQSAPNGPWAVRMVSRQDMVIYLNGSAGNPPSVASVEELRANVLQRLALVIESAQIETVDEQTTQNCFRSGEAVETPSEVQVWRLDARLRWRAGARGATSQQSLIFFGLVEKLRADLKLVPDPCWAEDPESGTRYYAVRAAPQPTPTIYVFKNLAHDAALAWARSTRPEIINRFADRVNGRSSGQSSGLSSGPPLIPQRAP